MRRDETRLTFLSDSEITSPPSFETKRMNILEREKYQGDGKVALVWMDVGLREMGERENVRKPTWGERRNTKRVLAREGDDGEDKGREFAKV